MRSIMAVAAQGEKVVYPIRWQKPWLPPDMCNDSRLSRTASLAGEVIPAECSSPRLLHRRFVVRICGDVQSHAQRYRQRPSPSGAKDEHCQHGEGTVEHPRGGLMGCFRLIVEANGRQGIQAPLVNAKPHVVIGVDEDARRPGSDYVAAEPRVQHRCTRCGERYVISDSH
jgi:hypothetical protein